MMAFRPRFLHCPDLNKRFHDLMNEACGEIANTGPEPPFAISNAKVIFEREAAEIDKTDQFTAESFLWFGYWALDQLLVPDEGA
jgi:hypothetical protein